MQTETSIYRNILVPVDGSAPASLGLREAVKLAKSHGSRLRLVHVVNEIVITSQVFGAATPYPSDLFARMRADGEKILQDAESLARSQGVEAERILLESAEGPAADQIITHAEQWPAELIVMGTHGRRGVRRMVMGSDAEQIVRRSAVPVLLVRGADGSE